MTINRGALVIVLLVLVAVPSCHELTCTPENILTIAKPARVESFQMRDKNGIVLWEVRSDRPRELSAITYGEVPEGYIQTIPGLGERPRTFTAGEVLSTVTTTNDRVFMHDGYASGVSGFCGGYYQSSPRPGHEPPK